MAAEGQTTSIRDRINAFNIAGKSDHLGRAPVTAHGPSGQKPDRASLDHRSHSTTVPDGHYHAPFSNGIGNEPNPPRKDAVLPPPTNIVRTGQTNSSLTKPPPPPRLPPRKQSSQPSPALPPRRPSDQLSRKASNESISSTFSSLSVMSNCTTKNTTSRAPSFDAGRIKAPAFDPSTLPPLPPKRTKQQVDSRYSDIEKSKAFPAYKDVERRRISLQSTKSSSSVATLDAASSTTKTPALPPRRPSNTKPDDPTPPSRKLSTSSSQAPPKPPRSALSYGMNKEPEAVSTNDHNSTKGSNGRDSSPQRPVSRNEATPPVPLNSRPDLSKLQATKPKPSSSNSIHASTASSTPPCLLCRDFSAVDAHAAKYPREQVPSLDWLASQLTDPFPSLTDKARSIFTWLHHNISYDVVAFFNNAVQPSTPLSTLQTGLAVCEGYAALFTAIASKCGLESVVVGGHGKGFSFASLAPGSPLPPETPTGHAWNAVKIDNNHWKLIDPCWGAGNVSGKGQPYNKLFSPRQFTMSNAAFGLRHFPANRAHFFVDGRPPPPTWSEYILGPLGGAPALTVYGGVAETEGISETSFLPPALHVPIAQQPPGPTVRFQFSRVCEHWSPQRNGQGKAYVFILQINGLDGREKDYLPFETNGTFWWVDVEPRRLGVKGQTVSAYTVETVGGVTGRGLSVEDYRAAKGRKGMGFGGLACWELV